MKNLLSNRYVILLSFFLLIPLFSYSQTFKLYSTRNYHNQLRLNTVTGEVMQIQDDGQSWTINVAIEPYGEWTNRFRLYETQNIWNFILLDTFTGRLWQCQFSVNGVEQMMTIPINTTTLADSSCKSVFNIQPLTSMYQFYLINEDTGEMWKFQWSTKGDDYRWIERCK
jgi:hypothetical protein